MRKYKDLSGDSGVAAFQIGTDSIIIRFKPGGTYRYDAVKPGKRHVEKMKKLALSGDGLATYINQEVRDNYAAKIDDRAR